MPETTANPAYDISLRPNGARRWTTHAAEAWRNPGGGLWGGYALGLCVRTLEAEADAAGEPLSMTLTYAAGLPSGELDVRTRRLRQGGSIGVWEVELRPQGVDEVGVHGMVTLARRPATQKPGGASKPLAKIRSGSPSRRSRAKSRGATFGCEV